MDDGYCTVDDVRRVLRKAQLSKRLADDNNQLVVDTITAVSATVEKATKKHWYVPDGVEEDSQGVVATTPDTRDDEYGLPTTAALVHGESERDRRVGQNSDALLEAGPRHDQRRRDRRESKREIRIAVGDPEALEPPVDETTPAYCRIRLGRKDVSSITGLHVINADGGYDDWVDNAAYSGGIGPTHRGDDYWVRINNGGVSELHLDVHALADDIASLSNAVYAAIEYGRDTLPTRIRRGAAYLAASELVLDDELMTAVPSGGTLVGVETKAERWARLGLQKLEQDVVDDEILETYR